jgi:hypothetical protein
MMGIKKAVGTEKRRWHLPLECCINESLKATGEELAHERTVIDVLLPFPTAFQSAFLLTNFYS